MIDLKQLRARRIFERYDNIYAALLKRGAHELTLTELKRVRVYLAARKFAFG